MSSKTEPGDNNFSLEFLDPTVLTVLSDRLLEALSENFTYNLSANPFTIFGFFWGIPIPAFFLFFHWYLTSESLNTILTGYPIHWIFMVHPIIFAFFFGAIGNIYLHQHEELKYKANHDELTGLLTHQKFSEKVKRLLNDPQLVPEKLSLIMLDLDHFKKINDELGHQEGDRVLKEVAGVLKNMTRDSDYLCRFGGEEFALALPGSSSSQAYSVGERIRREVASKSRAFPKNLTLSSGISTFPQDGRDLEDLIDKADELLYQAKADGRNRTVSS